MASGRKIPEDMENPFDNIILRIAEGINPKLRALGVTPNILTTISLIMGVASAVFVYWGWFALGALMFLLAYVFDCMDGNMARAFDMVTTFGDFYDHATDLLTTIFLVTAIVVSPIRFEWKVSFFVPACFLYIASYIHIGCQERVYGESVPSLRMLEALCPEAEKTIYITRYFGTGTTVMYVVIFLIMVDLFKGRVGGQCRV